MIGELLSHYWAVLTGLVTMIAGYATLREKVRKVEKYTSELFGRVVGLEKDWAAQVEINKNYADQYNRIERKLETIEALLRNKQN